MRTKSRGLLIALVGCAVACGGSAAGESEDSSEQRLSGSGGGSACPFTTGGAGGIAEPDLPDYVVVASADATIAKATPDTNFGNDTTCTAKGHTTERACLLKFGLAGVPTNLTITKACLKLSISDPSVREFSPRRLLQSWTENGATWNERESGAAWGLPGAKAATDRDPVDLAIIPESASGTITIPFDVSTVQSWISNPSTNHGITIANSAAYDGISFHSAEAAASLMPRLLFE